MDEDDIDALHEMAPVAPADVDWSAVRLLQVQPYDCQRAIEITEPGPIKLMPLPGTDRRYGAEIVYKDDTWDRLLFTANEGEATALVHRLSAEHDIPVRWSSPPA